ncbi:MULTISPECIES: hypothetical protein [unclassified Streptomyces]|uniref:hypothetical protein n=1 Tax=unclassified Streptomyces TaxID=2593676 RepID=UPI0038142EC0
MNTNPLRRDQPVDHHEPAELLPAPGRPVLAQDRHRVLREHLMEHITHEHESTHEQSGATTTPPPSPARRRLILVAAPLALAAVVGLGVVAVDTAQDGKHGTTAADVTAAAPQKATQLLDRIALAAADRPAVTARDDQYVYTKSQGAAVELGVDGAIMDEATLLPDLSAAIYRATAKLPGASVVDHVKDAAGREGVGLTFKGAPKGYAWVFDSSSLVYLGTTDAALLEVGVTDKTGDVPVSSS